MHGTSMGGMVTIAFAGKYPEATHRGLRRLRHGALRPPPQGLLPVLAELAEAMPLDDMCDLITIQAVSADFIAANPGIFDIVRSVISRNAPYTIRHACLAMENMDIEHIARSIRRPILFTNGTTDTMTPPRLAAGGFSAHDVADAIPDWAEVYEFPDIGHACLLEAPDEAVRIVTAFFEKAMAG